MFAKAQTNTDAVDAASSSTREATESPESASEPAPIPERGTAGSTAVAEVAPAETKAVDSDADLPPASGAIATEEKPRSSTPEPIAALLTGIRLPANLEPVVADGVAPSDHYLCLHTKVATPEDVGIGLAEELERLGYTVMGISETEAVAARDDDVVSLQIDPAPAETAIAGIRRFPMASVGDVVVEVWSGAGPKPAI